MVYNWSKLRHSFYPSRCVLCGGPGEGERDLCPGCRRDLPYNRHPCHHCALPLPASASPGSLCGECQKKPPRFDRCLAPFDYTSPLDHLVGGLKFHGRLSYGRLLADLLGGHLLKQTPQPPPDLIIPVPLHPSRLRERGFNQALELARPIGTGLNIPLETGLCKRIRHTAPQLGLDKGARRRNIRGAFDLEGDVQGRRIALVDDVVTTGSTVNELARLLRRHGAEEIWVWAVARRGLGK